MSKASGTNKTCPQCGALFYVQAHRVKQAKFCSMKCMWIGRPKRDIRMIECLCEGCQRPYMVKAYREEKTRFCSRKCSTKTIAPKRQIAIARAELADPGHKICTQCGEQKQTSEFWKHVNGFDGRRSKCISCSLQTQAEWNAANHGKKLESDRRYYADNADQLNEASRAKYAADPEVFSKRNKAWRDKNIEQARKASRQRRIDKGDVVRAERQKHYRENKARYKAQAVARVKHIKQATPSWADMEKIAAFYAEAERLTAETGIPHHVDHVYPLRGKTMCGLHVEGNLQILHAVANLRKSNRVHADDGMLDHSLPGENCV
jgi:hypothetical protein